MPSDIVPSEQYNRSAYLIRRLFVHHMKPYMGRLSLAVFCMILVGVTTASMAYVMERVIDDIFLNKDRDMLLLIAASVFVLFIIKGLALYGQNFLMQCLGQRIIADLQMLLYRHLLHLDLAQVTGEASGKTISRFTNEIGILRSSVTIILTGMTRETVTLALLVAVMFYQSFSLSMITFFAFPVAIYPLFRLGRRMRKISNSTQENMGEFTVRLDETFSGAREIKACQQEEFEIARASRTVEGIYALFTKAARNQSASSPIMEMVGGVAIAAVIWYGGSQVIDGGNTAGQFFSFITAAMMAYKPAKTLSGMNTTLQDGLAAARRLFILLDTKPHIVDKPDSKPLILPATGTDIIFDNVHFNYTPEKQALKGLSLEIKAGQTVALVGPSGGGKSTIMNLLLRFYDTESGTIRINNTEIRDVTIASLRNNIAFVSQNITLFDDTVAANIAYARHGASLEEIKEAARHAAADEFITQLPDGYNTIIGQDGATLSGGQRQRLAIARAMLKNAPILLLDEATSALDKISEKKIQAALEILMKGRTTLVIAHRLSTIEKADQIFVIQQGRVAESGSHTSLLQQGGVYSRLHKGMEEDTTKE